jgi:hypothetical protein
MMVMPSESGWNLAAPRGSWLWIAGIVLAFALLDGVHTQAGFLAEGNPQSWVQTLRETAIFWLVYAAFIPLVLFIADRFPLDPRRPRNILIHLAAALSFTYLHVVVVAFSVLPWRPASTEWVPLLGRGMRFNFAINFLTYCAIVGAMYGVRLYTQARRRELTTAQLEVSLAAARLEVLRAQLNPHFLFNTLNAISTLILDNENRTANQTIMRLSEFLRYTLDQDPMKKVTLRQEVEAMNLYLTTEKLRFGERLRLEFAIEERALEALVPSLLLQPLIENAVKYAISPSEQGGMIRVEGRARGAMLELAVADDGPGLTSQTLGVAAPGTGRGVGLRNIRERLAVLYEDRHRFATLDNKPGLRIELGLPLEMAPS